MLSRDRPCLVAVCQRDEQGHWNRLQEIFLASDGSRVAMFLQHHPPGRHWELHVFAPDDSPQGEPYQGVVDWRFGTTFFVPNGAFLDDAEQAVDALERYSNNQEVALAAVVQNEGEQLAVYKEMQMRLRIGEVSSLSAV